MAPQIDTTDQLARVLTPLGAAILAGITVEAVRVAAVQGHVRTCGELHFGSHPVRLIGLDSAVSYWRIDDSRVDGLLADVVLEEEDGLFRWQLVRPPSCSPAWVPAPLCPHRNAWPCWEPPCSPLWHRGRSAR